MILAQGLQKMPVVSIFDRLHSFEILDNASFSSTYLLVLSTKMVDDEDGRNKSGGDREKRGVGLESDLRPLTYDSGRKILWAVTRIWPRLLP